MVGHFSTPITPESGSFLHADSHSQVESECGVLRLVGRWPGIETVNEALHPSVDPGDRLIPLGCPVCGGVAHG